MKDDDRKDDLKKEEENKEDKKEQNPNEERINEELEKIDEELQDVITHFTIEGSIVSPRIVKNVFLEFLFEYLIVLGLMLFINHFLFAFDKDFFKILCFSSIYYILFYILDVLLKRKHILHIFYILTFGVVAVVYGALAIIAAYLATKQIFDFNCTAISKFILFYGIYAIAKRLILIGLMLLFRRGDKNE